MTEEKKGKLREIKETVSSGVELIRQVTSPGTSASLGKILDTSSNVKEIIESLKTPEMVKNIENFRLISENMNEISSNIQNAMRRIEDTGIIDDVKGMFKSASRTMEWIDRPNSVGTTGQNLLEMVSLIRIISKSVKFFTEEFLISSPSESPTVHNITEVIKDASHIYKTMRYGQAKGQSNL